MLCSYRGDYAGITFLSDVRRVSHIFSDTGYACSACSCFYPLTGYSAAHAKNLSAEKAEASASARLPRTHPYRGWSQDASAPSPQGPRQSFGIVEGMPQKYRLTIADLKTFRPDRRLSSTYFSLAVARASRAGVACVVSKKVSVRAVDRNRIKRRLRATLLPHLSRLPPASYVWYAKKEAATAAYAEVARDVEKLLARVA